MSKLTGKQVKPMLSLKGLENLARAAKAAGVPQDALKRFIAFGYIPQPKQLLFHGAARLADLPEGPTDIGYGGARGGGKTRCAISQVVLDDCFRCPELKVLFLRKIARAARESFDDLRRQALWAVPHVYRKQEGVLETPNGSRVVLGHFKDETGIDNYLGLEYDVIAIEEATTLSPGKKRDIKTCLRTSKPHWRPRIYQTTNPGGVDHEGFKKTFIIPWRDGIETTTRFIPATVLDNKFVNVEYKSTLEGLIGWKRKAWLDGEWDIAAGQFFTNWRHDLHVIEPFKIPRHWPVWAALDYGFTHPTSVHFFTENDGTFYVIGHHHESKRLPEYHAETIKALCRRYTGRDIDGLWTFVAGADVFAQKGDASAKTIADQYREHGIKLIQAPMDRITGWSEILKLLGDDTLKPPIPPRLKIFNTCIPLIQTLPVLSHDPDRPEDVLKIDVDEDGSGGDDSADSLRYGLMARLLRQKPGQSQSTSLFG